MRGSDCTPDLGGRCAMHGGDYFPEDQQCRTERVLSDVQAERAKQFAVYGTNEDLEDGTGAMVRWLHPVWDGMAVSAETLFRMDYEGYLMVRGKPTWMHLVREEVAEVFIEDDPARLRTELVQVAALCVSWVEKLDARAEASPPTTPTD